MSINIVKAQSKTSSNNDSVSFNQGFRAKEEGFTYTYDSQGNKRKTYNYPSAEYKTDAAPKDTRKYSWQNNKSENISNVPTS